MNYTITLSPAEQKALEYIAINPNDWIENAVHERCRIAIDEIVNAEVQRLLEAGESINGSKDEIVLAAPIKSAAERNADAEAARLAALEVTP